MILKNKSSIRIDAGGKELPEEEGQLFNITVNNGDIHQFVRGHIPSHWHKELEIFVLLEGRIQLGIGDAIYSLQTGDGCFINTEVLHAFTADVPTPCTYRSFVFHPDIVGGTPGSIFDTAYVRPLLVQGAPFVKFQQETGDDIYFEQFHRVFQACTEESYGYEFQVRDALSLILLYVQSKNKMAGSPPILSVQEARLKKMLAWIDDNLGKNISVSQIAGTVNICPRECQRIFHQYLHYSPIEYVRRKRIFQAARQLSATSSSVTDIALNCGFPNPSYFSTQFKAFMGSTPSEYRCI